MHKLNLLLFIAASLYFNLAEGGKKQNHRQTGPEALITEYPYQVHVIHNKESHPRKNQHFSICGGSIIAPDVIITSAHCFRKGHSKPKQYLIRAGSSFLNGTGGSEHTVTRIVKRYHVDKRRPKPKIDVALAWVEPKFTFDETRAAIPLADTPAKYGDIGTATGWGMMKDQGTEHPEQLEAVSLKITGCSGENIWKGRKGPDNFCAKDIAAGSTFCKGNSGGPLATDRKLVGVISSAPKKCANKRNSSVYVSTTAFIDWVKDNTKEAGIKFL